MGKVQLENIKAYAHHGCLPQETNIGSDYLINVSVDTDLLQASISDQLKDTVDYVHINRIVKQEMAIPSKLLEHVAKRIIDRIFIELPSVDKANVSVSKINPPINGDVEKVTVSLILGRNTSIR
jgi:dihydroneopterin aldolase